MATSREFVLNARNIMESVFAISNNCVSASTHGYTYTPIRTNIHTRKQTQISYKQTDANRCTNRHTNGQTQTDTQNKTHLNIHTQTETHTETQTGIGPTQR